MNDLNDSENEVDVVEETWNVGCVRLWFLRNPENAMASALSLDTRGARWEEFSREKENYRQRSVQQQFNNGDFLERVGAVRD
jgi:hypothetical protein